MSTVSSSPPRITVGFWACTAESDTLERIWNPEAEYVAVRSFLYVFLIHRYKNDNRRSDNHKYGVQSHLSVCQHVAAHDFSTGTYSADAHTGSGAVDSKVVDVQRIGAGEVQLGLCGAGADFGMKKSVDRHNGTATSGDKTVPFRAVNVDGAPDNAVTLYSTGGCR